MGQSRIDLARMQCMFTMNSLQGEDLMELMLWLDDKVAEFKMTGRVGKIEDSAERRTPWWVRNGGPESNEDRLDGVEFKPRYRTEELRGRRSLLAAASSQSSFTGVPPLRKSSKRWQTKKTPDVDMSSFVEVEEGVLMYPDLRCMAGMTVIADGIRMMYRCSLCGVVFGEFADCELHMQTVHKDMLLESSFARVLSEFQDRIGLPDLICKLCQHASQSKADLYQHCAQNHEGNLGYETAGASHTEGVEVWSCLYCTTAEFQSIEDVALHLEHEHFLLKLRCDRCGSVHDSRNELASHMCRKQENAEGGTGKSSDEDTKECFHSLGDGVFMYKALSCSDTNTACEAHHEHIFRNRTPHSDFINQVGLSDLKCPMCSHQAFGKLELRMHMEKDHNRNYGYEALSKKEGGGAKCLFCSEVFTTTHTRDHHLDKAHWFIKYECPICHKLLSRQYRVKIHIGEVHGIKTTVLEPRATPSSSRDKVSKVKGTGDRVYRVSLEQPDPEALKNISEEQLKHYIEMKDNVLVYRHNLPPQQLPEDEEEEGGGCPREMIGRPGLVSLDCPHCQESHDTKQALYDHLVAQHKKNFGYRREETSDNGWQCMLCDRAFSTVKGVQRHLDADHWFIKFRCPRCYKLLSSDHRVKSHIVMVHGVKLTNSKMGRPRKNQPPKKEVVFHGLPVHGPSEAEQKEALHTLKHAYVFSPRGLSPRKTRPIAEGPSIVRKRKLPKRATLAKKVKGDEKVEESAASSLDGLGLDFLPGFGHT